MEDLATYQMDSLSKRTTKKGFSGNRSYISICASPGRNVRRPSKQRLPSSMAKSAEYLGRELANFEELQGVRPKESPEVARAAVKSTISLNASARIVSWDSQRSSRRHYAGTVRIFECATLAPTGIVNLEARRHNVRISVSWDTPKRTLDAVHSLNSFRAHETRMCFTFAKS